MLDSRNVVPGSIYEPIRIRANMSQGAIADQVVHVPMLRKSRLIDIVVGYEGAVAATHASPLVRIKNGNTLYCGFTIPTGLTVGRHYSVLKDQPSWLAWSAGYEESKDREINLGESLTFSHNGGGTWVGYHNIFLVVVPFGLAPYQYSS